MTALLQFLDRYPQIYPGVVLVAFTGVLVVSGWSFLSSRPETGDRSDWRWGFVIGALLLAGRWPTLLIPRDFNSDESQLLAGAHTLAHDPVFWRTVDGATAGPLDLVALWPAGTLLGWDSYATSRVTALLLLALSLLLAHQCVARMAGIRVARLVVLPAVALEGLTNAGELLYYSTELLPVTLLAVAAYAAMRRAMDQVGPRWAALGGLALGAVPLAKLQAAPLAAVFGLGWLFMEWRRPRPAGDKTLFLLVGGALFPAALFAWQLTLIQGWPDFFTSYILFNFNYTARGALSPATLLKEVWALSVAEDSLLHLWLAAGGLGLVCLLRPANTPEPRARRVLAMCAGAAAIALACVLAAGRPFLHYWQLVVVPFTLLAGAVAARALGPASAPRAVLNRWLLLLVSVCATGGLLMHRVRHPNRYLGAFAFFQQYPRSELADAVAATAQPGDAVAIWGICNRVYVEAGLRQGARDAQFERAVVAAPLRDYFRRRFLRDIVLNKPALFLDATGSDGLYYHQPQFAHDVNFPELAAVIRDRYELRTQTGGARIYRRREPLAP